MHLSSTKNFYLRQPSIVQTRQSGSIPVPTAQAAVLTSVLLGAFSLQWIFLCQDFEISRNRLKSFRSLEICKKKSIGDKSKRDKKSKGDKLSKRVKLGCTYCNKQELEQS